MKQALKEGIDFYYENGYMVFIEKYLRDRGYCCGNGCRHCPYNYEKVPEPLKSQLLERRPPKSPGGGLGQDPK